MTETEQNKKLDSFADNVLAKIIARYVVPPMGIAAITIGSWYLNKLDHNVTRIGVEISTANADNRMLRSEIELRAKARDRELSDINTKIVDHENRIRPLERALR